MEVPFIMCRHQAGIRLSDAALTEYNMRLSGTPHSPLRVEKKKRRKYHNELRCDPVMAQVVTQLGARASGKGARLSVKMVDAKALRQQTTSHYDVWIRELL